MQQNTNQEDQSAATSGYSLHTTATIRPVNLQSWNGMNGYIPSSAIPSTTFQSNNYRTMQTPDALAFHPTAFVAGANSYATTQSPMQSINAAANMLPLQGNFSTTNSFDQDNLHVGYPFNGYHGFSYVPGYTSADFAPLQSADSSSFGSSTASDLDMDMDTAMGSNLTSQYSWPGSATAGAYTALSEATHLILGDTGYQVGSDNYTHLPSNLHSAPTDPVMPFLPSQRVRESEMGIGGQVNSNNHPSCFQPCVAAFTPGTSECCYNQQPSSPSGTAFESFASSASEGHDMFQLSPESWSGESPLLIPKDESVSPTASLLDYNTNLQDASAADDDFFKSSPSSPALNSRASPAQSPTRSGNMSARTETGAQPTQATASHASARFITGPNPGLSDAVWLARLRPEDRQLVEGRRSGRTYSQIKRDGNYVEQESSLRGRYRTLIKPKEERVRKPEWKALDIKLLQTAVRNSLVQTAVRNRGGSPRAVKNRISWKEVSEYISDHGGSYRFGVSTCKKMYEEINGSM